MKASIIKIGNSQGIRLPKPILEQCGFNKEVEIEIRDHELILKSPDTPRANWAIAFQAMAVNNDDQLLDPVSTTEWDAEEWEWK